MAERRASTWLQAAIEMQIDPQVLLLAVRDPSGRIVDLEYGDANQSACDYYGVTHEHLVGSRLLDFEADPVASGVLAVCRQVFDTGEDLILHDVAFPREQEHGEARQYDIWARTMGGTLAYSWCDVTERF